MPVVKQQNRGTERRSIFFQKNKLANTIPLLNMKRLCGIIVALIGIISGVEICAQVVIDEDFSVDKKLSRRTSIQNGKLLLNAGNKLASYAFNNLNVQNCDIILKSRILRSHNKERHFGLIIKGETSAVRVYFRTHKALWLITKGNKKIHSKTLGKISTGIPEGENSDFTEIQISIREPLIEVNFRGVKIGSINYNITPIKKITLYAYREDVEVESFKVESFRKKKIAVKKNHTGKPDFYASYDNTLDGKASDGKLIKPNKKQALTFKKGLRGQGVYLSSKRTKNKKYPLLEYPAEDLFKGESGTLMFWFKPDWDGTGKNVHPPFNHMFQGLDSGNNKKLDIFAIGWLRADLARTGRLSKVSINRRCKKSICKGDWSHFALVWNKNGWNKLYFNNLPYHQGNIFMKEKPRMLSNIDLSTIKTFLLGSQKTRVNKRRKNANAVFDELKIYNSAISPEKITEEYRKYMPVDIIMDRSVVFADNDESVKITVAPGGYYERPAVSSLPNNKAKIELKLELIDQKDNKLLKEQTYKLNVDKPLEVKLPVGKLPEGEYRLLCHVKQKSGIDVQRTFSVLSYMPKKALRATNADAKLGKPFIEIDFDKINRNVIHEGKINLKNSPLGKYIETDDQNGSRFGVEIEFPEKYLNGKPVMLEIQWPDNKPRNMALYMYPEAKRKQHRDRLEGGIQSGEEYPLTNKIQTTKYLFYPGVKRYLFEARTMANGYPAAVKAIKFYPIEGRLPKLKINYPKGGNHRSLGHMDEDQTFDVMLNRDDEKERFDKFRTAKIMERLCDYFDYTGQDTIAYPVLRYFYVFYPLMGYGGNGMFPFGPREMPLFIEMLNRRKMNFIGIINFRTMPEIFSTPEKNDEYLKMGMLTKKSDGNTVNFRKHGFKNNFLHAKVRKFFLRHVKEIAKRYGNIPGFTGVELWLKNFGSFASIEEGYGEYTVNMFSKETGTTIPKAANANWTKRYAYLTGKAKNKWLKWRAEKVTRMVKETADAMHEFNPDLKLYVAVGGPPLVGDNENESIENQDISKYYYENFGIDLKAIKSLPKVYTVPLRSGNKHRWIKHWGRPETCVNESIYAFKTVEPFMKNGTGYANTYPAYFETFRGSMKPKIYKSYFQNADVKPFGRYFLKDFAFSLAAMDAQRMLIGAQPLGTWGRDDITREFAKAYCALPGIPFKSVTGMKDPVTVRYLNTENGTYIYAVNILWSDCEVELTLPANTKVQDLATGKALSAGKNGKLQLKLKPYQLRSFFSNAKYIEIKKGPVTVPDSTIQFYQKKLNNLNTACKTIQENGMASGKYRKRLKQIDRLLKQGRYAEAHRLIFSKLMNALRTLGEVAKTGYLKEQLNMISKSRYAVNCGGKEYSYYRAKNGTLFFPDQNFKKGHYGYDGTYKNVVRDTRKLKKTDDLELFASEAYNLDAYRFKVKPGIYKVKVYAKVGYERNAKPNFFVMSLDIEGKRVLDNKDLFAAGENDFWNAVTFEFDNIKVSDGILDIEFSSQRTKNAALCNAIEVIPQKKAAR
jgi:Malectin domain